MLHPTRTSDKHGYPLKRATPAEALAVRDAWGDWLQTFPWDFFLTITCREPLPAYRADTVVNSIGKQLCKQHRPESVFIGSEPHRSNLTHFHGLLRLPEGRWREENPSQILRLFSTEIWRSLFETYGRSSVEVIRGPEDVCSYVSKYVTKDLGSYGIYGRADWDPARREQVF